MLGRGTVGLLAGVVAGEGAGASGRPGTRSVRSDGQHQGAWVQALGRLVRLWVGLPRGSGCGGA